MAFRHIGELKGLLKPNPDMVTRKTLVHFASVPAKAGRTAKKADKAKK